MSRRGFLGGGLAVGLGALSGPGIKVAHAAARSSELTGLVPVLAAMHVHGSYSEGPASWQQQFDNAAASGIDAVWMTDHDHRARARDYMTSLSGEFVPTATGTPARAAASVASDGSAHLLAESAGGAPFIQTLAMQDKPNAWNRLRTGIAGHSLTHTLGAYRLDAGALYEVVVTLSQHPLTAAGPAGQYSLRYRFGRYLRPSRYRANDGVTGIIAAPMPRAGVALTLEPDRDIAAIWPGMLAGDNCFYGLAFVVTSPRKGVVADVNLASLTIARSRSDALSVLAAMNALASRYQSGYGVQAFVSEEVGLGSPVFPHVNTFGAVARFDSTSGVKPTAFEDYYRHRITDVHAEGGLVSWNHVYGAGDAGLLTLDQQDALRRSAFNAHQRDGFFGADLLEVGYTNRGSMPFGQFLALWDTFSRCSRFLTGNGVNDDHSGQPWTTLTNGFCTGIWSDGLEEANLVRALAGGRAYTAHAGWWPMSSLDMLADGRAPMGSVLVGAPASHDLAVSVANLPAGGSVDLLMSPVDGVGPDPATAVVSTFSADSLDSTGTGTVSTTLPPVAACFVRAQVRLGTALIATGNPIWFLDAEPAGGTPVARRVA